MTTNEKVSRMTLHVSIPGLEILCHKRQDLTMDDFKEYCSLFGLNPSHGKVLNDYVENSNRHQ